MTAFEPPTPPGLQLEDLAGSPGRNRTEHLVRLALTGAAATSVLISVAIIYVLRGVIRDRIQQAGKPL